MHWDGLRGDYVTYVNWVSESLIAIAGSERRQMGVDLSDGHPLTLHLKYKLLTWSLRSVKLFCNLYRFLN